MGSKRKGRFQIGAVALILLFIIIGVFAVSQEEPISLEAHIGCLGTKDCILGSVAKVELSVNSKNQELDGSEVLVSVDSPAFFSGSHQEAVKINSVKEIEIPINVELSEGNYEVSISTEFVKPDNWINNLLLNLKHRILFTKEKMVVEESVKVRFPDVEVDPQSYVCTERGFYFENILLKHNDQKISSLDCGIRIYTNKLINTSHSSLKEFPETSKIHFFETDFFSITKKELSGSIQKVEFIADPAVQVTNTKVVPMCMIEGKKIAINPSEKNMENCTLKQNIFEN